MADYPIFNFSGTEEQQTRARAIAEADIAKRNALMNKDGGTFRGQGGVGEWNASIDAVTRRQYDTQYPKGKGPRPVYPDPGGLYTPGGPDNPPYPGATVDRRAEADRNARLRGVTAYRSGGYDASMNAKEGVAAERGLGDLPQFYGPDEAWDYRNRIRGGMEPSSYGPTADKDIFIPQGVGGKPGERIVTDYGVGANTGFGSTRVMATADKTGRFNSYSDVPGEYTGRGSGAGGYAAPADPYGIHADIAATRQRLAGYRGGTSLADRILAGGAQRRLNKLQQLGISGGQLDLAERRYNPDIAVANYRNNLLRKGDIQGVQELTAALGGHPNIITTPEIGSNMFLRPRDIPPAGGLRVPTTTPNVSPQLPTIPPPVTSPYRASTRDDDYYR